MSPTRSIAILYPGKIIAQTYRLQARVSHTPLADLWLSESDGKPCLLKIFSLSEPLSAQQWQKVEAALTQTQHLNHTLLAKPIDWGISQGMPYLVLPYFSYGNAGQWAGKLSESELATFMYQASSVLEYLHSRDLPVLHRNLHPGNLLIDEELNYVLSDTLVSGMIRQMVSETATSLPYSQAYLAPECIYTGNYGRPADVFSLGVTLYEMATGALPFGAKGGQKLLEGGRVPKLPTTYSARFQQVMQVCLARTPEGRPDAKTLKRLAQSYLDEASWSSVPGFSFGPAVPTVKPRKRIDLTKKINPLVLKITEIPRAVSVVAASITLGIGITLFGILPLSQRLGLTKFLQPKETQTIAARSIPVPEPEPVVLKMTVTPSNEENRAKVEAGNIPPELTLVSPIVEKKPPKVSTELAATKAEMAPIKKEKETPPPKLKNSHSKALGAFLSLKAQVKADWEELSHNQETLDEPGRAYLTQLSAELNLLEQQIQSKIVKEEGTDSFIWLEGKENPSWLRHMEASLKQHVRNMRQINIKIAQG